MAALSQRLIRSMILPLAQPLTSDPTLNLDFTTMTSLPGTVTFSRASTATYFNASGVMQTAASGSPRFDFDPITHVPRGLLIEEARTNLLLYSDDFSNAAWAQPNIAVTANAITSPDGTLTADKFLSNTFNGTHNANQSAAKASGTAYTFVVSVKAAEYGYALVGQQYNAASYSDNFFDLTAGTWTVTGDGSPTLSAQSLGNGWWRLAVTVTASGTGSYQSYVGGAPSTSVVYAGDNASGLYVWGAQLEAGTFATSYIPTAAATVTRAADVVTLGPTGGVPFAGFNANEGTLAAEVIPLGTPPAATYPGFGLTAAAGNSLNSIAFYGDSSNVIRGLVESSSTIRYNPTLATAVNGSVTKLALAYKQGSYGGAGNGSAATGGTDNNALPVVTQLKLSGLDNPFNGWIKRIRYFPLRQPDESLQILF
jgi:hypothetical protein